MSESRIPILGGTSKKAASSWLSALHTKGLLFCLDDQPEDIVSIADGSRTFTDDEAKEVSRVLNTLFAKCGDELHGLAFEVLSKTFHTRTERKAFKTMYG